jgi:tetratricopeptide (TPR) repeat protein
MDLEDKHQDVARAAVDAAVKRNGKDGRTAALAGETYVALGDYAAAEPVLRQAIETDPSNLRTYGLLAQVLAAQKRLADGVREFETMAERAPKSVGVQTFVAVLLHVQNRTEEARAQYQKVLEIDPRAPGGGQQFGVDVRGRRSATRHRAAARTNGKGAAPR